MIARLDLWILQHIYQAIVDISQRKPVWWAEQCAYATGAMVLAIAGLRIVDNKFDAWLCIAVVTSIISTVSMLICCKTPAVFARMGTYTMPRRMSLCLLITLALSLLVNFTANGLMCLLANLTYISFDYFAACEPPRPRTRLNFAGGAA